MLFIRVTARGRPAEWRLRRRVVSRGAHSDRAGLEKLLLILPFLPMGVLSGGGKKGAQRAGLRIPYSPSEEFKHRNQMGPGHGRNQMASASSRLGDHGGQGRPGLGIFPSPW